MAVHTVTCNDCGFTNVPAAKFCANCGRPLSAAGAGPILTGEARKVITAVFVDLVGSTALTERLDPEEARLVIGQFYDVVHREVARFEGTVANYLGDAALAVFGLPVAHEDDPERAVRAGLAVRDALPALNERLEARHGLRLQIRAGINTGDVVAASGSTFDRDFLISDAVTTAARIQQTVAPGTVVVGERTYRLTRDTVAYRSLPALEVKGKTDRLMVWEAVAPFPQRHESRRRSAPLLGRHLELSLLRQLYERTATDRTTHLVTLLGQPGIGKSRLVRELLAELREATPPPLVLRGRSLALGGQIGYHALQDILRAQSGVLDSDPPDAVRTKLQAWLHGAVPEQPDLLEGLLLTFALTNGAGTDPGEVRNRLFAAWRRLFVCLAASRPVVAIFEDMHWADDAVLDLLQSVIAGTDDAALLLLCLGRPDLLERRSGWGGGRNAMTIDLRPLRAEDTARLVEALAQDELSPELRLMIAERAEGNPLFAEELVRMLVEGAAASPPGGPVTIPDSVQAVITSRIDRLPHDERRILQAGAVIGRTFWTSVAAQLAGLAPEDAVRATAGLVAKEFVARRLQSTIADEDEYAFRHNLTRDVAYGMLPRSQRQRAHGEAARWFEARLGPRIEEVIEVVAEHLRLAGDDARAAGYLRRAAGKARRQYANADAIRLYDQAMESARRASLTDQIPRLFLERGEVHQHLGTYAAALADFEAGLAEARRLGDQGLEVALENRVGLVHHREGRVEEAESHFAQAARGARAIGDRVTLGLSLVDLATVHWDRGDLHATDRLLGEGIVLLREASEGAGLARALNLRCMTHLALGNGDEAVAAAQEALVAARAAGDRSREATSLSYLSVVHNWTGRPSMGIEYAHAAMALAESIGDRRRVAYAREFLAQALQDLGEWGEAIRLTLDVLPSAQQVTPAELPFLHTFLGQMYHEIGDIERAREAFQVGARFDARSFGWQLVTLLAASYLAQIDGDHEGLRRVLDQVLTLPAGSFAPVEAYACYFIGEGLWRTGRIGDLQRFADGRRPTVVRLKTPAGRAGLALLDGFLAIHDGRLDAAAAHMDEAVAAAEAGEHAIMTRASLEWRLHFFHRDEDRTGLQRLHARLAASLPDDLREIFLASARVRAVEAV